MAEISLPRKDIFSFTDKIVVGLHVEGNCIGVCGEGRWYRSDIGGRRDGFRETSERIRELLANLFNSTDLSEEFSGYMDEIAKKGYYLFTELFPDEHLQHFIANCVRGNEGSTVQIVTDGFDLPWNLLYINNPLDEDSVNPFYFLGMRHSIELIEGTSNVRPVPKDQLSVDMPSLGLLALAESDLFAVDKHEIPFFESLQENGKLNYLLLEQLQADKRHKREELKKVEQFFEYNHSILHFACHGFSDEDPSESHLVISENFELTRADFKQISPKLVGTSIILINACESSGVSFHTSHFASDFYHRGIRSVIGTQSFINDQLAAEFIEYFYSNLLDGYTVGNSLLEARRRLWDERKSLLGLLYDLRGASNTQLVPPKNEYKYN